MSHRQPTGLAQQTAPDAGALCVRLDPATGQLEALPAGGQHTGHPDGAVIVTGQQQRALRTRSDRADRLARPRRWLGGHQIGADVLAEPGRVGVEQLTGGVEVGGVRAAARRAQRRRG